MNNEMTLVQNHIRRTESLLPMEEKRPWTAKFW